MELKIVKITKAFLRPNVYFADFLIEEHGLMLKAVTFNTKSNRITFPLVKTESGRAYSPYTFPDKETFQAITAKMRDMILSQPLPVNEGRGRRKGEGIFALSKTRTYEKVR